VDTAELPYLDAAIKEAQQRVHPDVIADTYRVQARPQQEASTGTQNPQGFARIPGSISWLHVLEAPTVKQRLDVTVRDSPKQDAFGL